MAGVTLFCQDYARDVLKAQLAKEYPAGAMFGLDKVIDKVWPKLAQNGFVLGQALDGATTNRMLDLKKNVEINFRSAQNGEGNDAGK